MKSKILIFAILFCYSFVALASNDNKSITEILNETSSEETVDLINLNQIAKDLIVSELGTKVVQLSFRQVESEIYALGLDSQGNYIDAIKLSFTINTQTNLLTEYCGPCYAGDDYWKADVYFRGVFVHCFERCVEIDPGGPIGG